MKEILERNRYCSFGSSNELECYGPDIVDAINHNALVKHNGYSISQENLENFEFRKETNKALVSDMIKFYKESNEYIKNFHRK
jgi:hypothetical protein